MVLSSAACLHVMVVPENHKVADRMDKSLCGLDYRFSKNNSNPTIASGEFYLITALAKVTVSLLNWFKKYTWFANALWEN